MDINWTTTEWGYECRVLDMKLLIRIEYLYYESKPKCRWVIILDGHRIKESEIFDTKNDAELNVFSKYQKPKNILTLPKCNKYFKDFDGRGLA